jgi:hypothetical protein
LIDATTGLIYIGNGQYYDPETGRFLTRGVNPNSTNPYVPWNPSGGILVPIGLASVYYSRRKKRSKAMDRLVLFVFALLMMMNLACCHTPTTTPESTTEPDTTASTQGTAGPGNETPAIATGTPESPTETLTTPDPCADGNCTPTQTPTPSYSGQAAADWAKGNLDAEHLPSWLGTDCTNFVSQALHYGGHLQTDDVWKPYIQGTKCNPDTKDSDPDCPWIQTEDLHKYLLAKLGFTQKAHFAPFANNDTGDDKDYLLLRHNSTWEEFVSNSIQPGDLVFYHDMNYCCWNHVAIVIDGKGHTNDVLSSQNDGTTMQEPYIAEHDGPPRLTNPKDLADGIRTMGDTKNPHIGEVSILSR